MRGARNPSLSAMNYFLAEFKVLLPHQRSNPLYEGAGLCFCFVFETWQHRSKSAWLSACYRQFLENISPVPQAECIFKIHNTHIIVPTFTVLLFQVLLPCVHAIAHEVQRDSLAGSEILQLLQAKVPLYTA